MNEDKSHTEVMHIFPFTDTLLGIFLCHTHHNSFATLVEATCELCLSSFKPTQKRTRPVASTTDIVRHLIIDSKTVRCSKPLQARH